MPIYNTTAASLLGEAPFSLPPNTSDDIDASLPIELNVSAPALVGFWGRF